jgi:hypothetical protein
MTVMDALRTLGMGERLAIIVCVWLAMLLLHQVAKWVYVVRTRGWLPMDKDTAWMLEAGYRCELPPSPVGPVLLAILLTIGLVLL